MIGIDFETYLINSQATPPAVCLTTSSSEISHVILEREDCTQLLARIFKGEWCAHNIAFDAGVAVANMPEIMDEIWDSFRGGRAHCTLVREKLLNMGDPLERGKAHGINYGVDLASCVKRYFGVTLGGKEEEDAWRYRYAELANTPVSGWPEGAVRYAIEDAVWAQKVYFAQEERAHKIGVDLSDASRQATVAFVWAWWAGINGVQIDTSRCREEVSRLESLIEINKEQHSWYRPDGTFDKKKAQQECVAAYPNMPLTEKGAVSLSKKTVGVLLPTMNEEIAEKLRAHYQIQEDRDEVVKMLSPMLRAERSEGRLFFKADALKETGRTGASDPNMQNRKVEGETRSCIIAEEGRVLLWSDFGQAEVRSFAFVCQAEGISSLMAERWRGDVNWDPHLYAAAMILGLTEAEAGRRLAEGDKQVAKARKLAKVMNFGLLGGIGAATFHASCQDQGLLLDKTTSEVAAMIAEWKRVWPEVNEYFRRRARLADSGGGSYVFPISGRGRFTERYTELCNTPFQGVTSDGAKEAMLQIHHECYFDACSPLYGATPILFVHDEFVLEVDDDRGVWSAAARRLEEVMVKGMETHTPDVPAVVESTVARRWVKKASSVWDNGELSLWG